MKKDIYIIKNRINSKIYVGQSINVAERFINHCKPSSAINNNSLIDKAIQKYGANNFWFEIIESQIENYNEREKYWIQYFNTLKPNGYNIQLGGEEPPIHYGIDHPLSSFGSSEVIKALKDDIMFISFPSCTWKCEKECGKKVCQNDTLATAPNWKCQDMCSRKIP